jgi:hypothetical protein
MSKLVEIIREHLQRAHLTRHRSSHKGVRIIRILISSQLLVAAVAPAQDNVPLRKRFSHFRIEPILAEQPEQVVQLEIVKAFSEWSSVEISSNRAELLVAEHGLDLRSAHKTIFARQHSSQPLAVGSLKKILHGRCRRTGWARFPLADQNEHVISAALLCGFALQYPNDDTFDSAPYTQAMANLVGVERRTEVVTRMNNAVRCPDEVSICVPSQLILQEKPSTRFSQMFGRRTSFCPDTEPAVTRSPNKKTKWLVLSLKVDVQISHLVDELTAPFAFQRLVGYRAEGFSLGTELVFGKLLALASSSG